MLKRLLAAALQRQTPAVAPSCPGALDLIPPAEVPAAEVLSQVWAEAAAEAAAGWARGMTATAVWHALGPLAGCWLYCHWTTGGTAIFDLALQPVAAAVAAAAA